MKIKKIISQGKYLERIKSFIRKEIIGREEKYLTGRRQRPDERE